VGGPKQLLYWDQDWDATTRRSVHRIHTALMKGCEDEMEFALKLYAAWSEVHYHGQPLAPAWALRQVWRSSRMPPFSTKMREQLGPRAARFRKEVAAALDYASISHLVGRYGLEEVADTWLAEMKSALLQAQQQAWATAFFMHHSLLESRVEPERERLLNELSSNKKEVERRPINFDLLDRVRIIFAHLLTVQPSTFSSLSVSPLVRIRPEWLEVLKQLGHSQLALACFISAQTRQEDTGELISMFAYHRVFLDQCVPLGSRYQCQVTHVAPEGPIQLELVHRTSDAPATQEEFRSEGAVATEGEASADEVDTGERADVGDGVNATPDPIPSSGEHKVSPWPGLANTPWEVGMAPLQRGVDDHTEASAAPTRSASLPEKEAPLSEDWPDKTVGLLHLKDQDKQDYQVGDTLTVEVVDYNFDDPVFLAVIVRPVPDLEPFDAFTGQYQIGDVVTVAVKAYDERPNDPLISLVVQEPVSHLELLLEPEQLSFIPLGLLIKAIPLGTTLQAVVDDIDEEKRRVYLSCLPFMEMHLNRMLRARRSENGTYQVEAVVNQALQESLLLTLRWSEPARGMIYAVRMPTSILSEPVKTYRPGDACTLRLTFLEQSSSEVLTRLPTEIKKALGVQSGFERLSWKQHRLHFNGRMSYRVRNELLSLTNDRSYHRALRHLYSLSHRFTGEVIDGTIAGHSWETPESETHSCETMRNDVGQDDLQVADLVNEQATDTSPKGHETSRAALIPGTSPILNYLVGDRAMGRVTGVKEFGAFVELEPGASGLVHRSKMWGYVADAREVIHAGEEIEVLILNVSVERGNLELSMQIPEYDPLLHYHVGDEAVGRVTEVKEFGAFAELEPGVSGLVHRSKMWGYVADARDVVNLDDEVTVLILMVDMEKRRLELSMQVPEHDPLLRYQAGDGARGRVTEVKEFGAFVELEPGASGLVHRTEMRGCVIDARKVLNIGDEVEVLIIRVDIEERRLLLSMKEV